MKFFAPAFAIFAFFAVQKLPPTATSPQETACG
jgi:hypothetical protein